ncbi:MAG TPA: hypothetical protein VF396_04915, partial [Bradyrhizobium sp.]
AVPAEMPPARDFTARLSLLPQSFIAFAGQCLERFEIKDLDDAARIADCARRLYLAGDFGD